MTIVRPVRDAADELRCRETRDRPHLAGEVGLVAVQRVGQSNRVQDYSRSEHEGDRMPLVRLLGPVDVLSDDGSERQLGSALRRTILALLGLHAGQVLSPDWLMEHVWGD